MMLLLLPVLGLAIAAGAALVVAGSVALGPFFWVPYLLIYLVLRASGFGGRHRLAS